MTIEDDIAFLERVPLLKRLGTGALRILAIGTESYSVQAGEVLFSHGEAADCAYVVEEGSFALKPERLGEPESIAEPGALLGETALLVESPRLETAIGIRSRKRAGYACRRRGASSPSNRRPSIARSQSRKASP